jgi:hypothetical protein
MYKVTQKLQYFYIILAFERSHTFLAFPTMQ